MTIHKSLADTASGRKGCPPWTTSEAWVSGNAANAHTWMCGLGCSRSRDCVANRRSVVVEIIFNTTRKQKITIRDARYFMEGSNGCETT